MAKEFSTPCSGECRCCSHARRRIPCHHTIALVQLAAHPAAVLHRHGAVQQRGQPSLERVKRRSLGPSSLRSMLLLAAWAVMDRDHADMHDVVGLQRASYPAPIRRVCEPQTTLKSAHCATASHSMHNRHCHVACHCIWPWQASTTGN